MGDSQWVVDVTAEDFMSVVVEGSKTRPIVIDFWAPWCGPCRQLGPILESLAEEMNGAFLLAKVNTEDQPDLAGAFRIQSIPQVVAFVDGQPVSQFAGVQPEATIREWLAEFVGPNENDPLVQAEAHEAAEEWTAAEALYREAIDHDAEAIPPKIGLARVLIRQDRDADAGEILDALAARGFLEPEAERLRTELEVKTAASETGGVASAREALAADPDNVDLQLHLAEALTASMNYTEACEICLAAYAATKSDAARDLLLKTLELMPVGEEATQARRRLANLMY